MTSYKIKTGIIVFMFLITSASVFSQQGLTLEQSLTIAESNSPSIKKTRLGLIRSQENLNAQTCCLEIKLLAYHQSY